MPTGAITGYIDVAQLVLYAFWIFFAGLIFYLHRENKREGYPLESDRSGGRVKVQGFPAVPQPKTYKLASGTEVSVPSGKPDLRPVRAHQAGNHLGSPLVPEGDPMTAGVGPGSYAARSDTQDMTLEGQPRIVPLRVAGDFAVDGVDRDPRGMPVVGADGKVGGKVVDLWVDRSEMLFRYIELETTGGRRVLLPVNFSKTHRRGVKVRAITGGQFAGVPGTKSPDGVTFLEEEQIMAYYGAGTLYAMPSRQEPLL
jgi:photosynthetic reaction center H subunit